MRQDNNRQSFGCSFRYYKDSAFADVHEYLKRNIKVMPIRDAVKDSLIAFHYAAALETPSAIALSRSVLQRKLYDLDALENRLKHLEPTENSSEQTSEIPAATNLTPVSVNMTEHLASQDDFDNF